MVSSRGELVLFLGIDIGFKTEIIFHCFREEMSAGLQSRNLISDILCFKIISLQKDSGLMDTI